VTIQDLPALNAALNDFAGKGSKTGSLPRTIVSRERSSAFSAAKTCGDSSRE
jgi:hypothetical protein